MAPRKRVSGTRLEISLERRRLLVILKLDNQDLMPGAKPSCMDRFTGIVLIEATIRIRS
jgi:hypothetical protein